MKRFISEYFETLALIMGGISALAYGTSDFIPFLKGICILIPTVAALFYFFVFKHENRKDTALLEDLQLVFEEQEQVIKEYVTIFDSQLVELPCVCGGNTFQGLFSPKLENIVECENCKNKYRVTVNYDSVLLTEPLDLTRKFDDLVGKLS